MRKLLVYFRRIKGKEGIVNKIVVFAVLNRLLVNSEDLVTNGVMRLKLSAIVNVCVTDK